VGEIKYLEKHPNSLLPQCVSVTINMLSALSVNQALVLTRVGLFCLRIKPFSFLRFGMYFVNQALVFFNYTLIHFLL